MPPLWNHQRDAIARIGDQAATMMPYDMGTGKTRAAIEAMVADGCQRVLVLCPSKVVSVWPREFEKYAPEHFCVVALDRGTATDRARTAQLALFNGSARGDRVVIVVNYEACWRTSMRKVLLGFEWDLVVADESHRIKAPGGKASTMAGLLTRRSRKRLAMTGTPMPHSPLDVYGQYRFLDPTIFGTSYAAFRNRYARMGGQSGEEVQEWRDLDELQRKFYSIALPNIQAGDVLDLPEIHVFDRVCTLEPSARRVYEQLAHDFESDLTEGKVTAANVLTRLMRLGQVASGTIKTDAGEPVPVSQAKESLMEEVLDEIAHDEPVVVFCRFRSDLAAVHRVAAAAHRTSKELSGSRNELLEWQEGQGSVLAVQIQSGGVGIDLTRARYAVYYSVNYSMGDYDQSAKREHRPGQTRTCFAIHLIAEDTIDRDIYTALRERRDLVNSVLQRHTRRAA